MVALSAPSTAAYGEAFEDIVPGETKLTEVVSRFGPPSRSKKLGNRQHVYYEASQPIGSNKVVHLEVGNDGVVKEIWVLPARPWAAKVLARTFGGPCEADPEKSDVQRSSEVRACYVKSGTRARPELNYASLGLTAYLSPDHKRVVMFRYEPTQVSTPAGSESSTPPEPSEPEASATPEPSAESAPPPAADGGTPLPVHDAPPAEADEGPAALPSGPEVKLSGRVRARGHESFIAQPGKITSRREVDAAVNVQASLGITSAFATLLLRHDFADPTRDRYEAAEAYVDVKFDFGLEIWAGRRIVRWSTVSLYSVTDILNPVDFRDALDQEKRATWMVQASFTKGPLRLEAMYLPVAERWILPPATFNPQGQVVSNSVWAPPDLPPMLNGRAVTYASEPPAVDSPDAALRFPQIAERVVFQDRTTHASLGHMLLFDRLPTARLDDTDPNAVHVSLAYRRFNAITLGLAQQLGPVRLAAEGIFYLMLDGTPLDVERNFFRFVAGADWLSPPFLGGQRVHLFVEFTDTYALTGGLVPATLSLRYPWEKTFFALALYHLSRALTFSVFALKPITNTDLLVSPAVQYFVTPMVNARLGFSILAGNPAVGLLGRYTKNTRIELSMEATF
jgi:hypothetical protein